MKRLIQIFLIIALMLPGAAFAVGASSFAICPDNILFDLTSGNAWLYCPGRDLDDYASGTSKPWLVTITDSSSPAQSIKGRIGVAGSGWNYSDSWTQSPNKSSVTPIADLLGGELVTDGTFDIDGNGTWINQSGSNWVVSGGSMQHLAGLDKYVRQESVISSAGLYRVQYTLDHIAGGDVWPYLYFNSTPYRGKNRSSDGTFVDYISLPGFDIGRLYFLCGADFNGVIDNVTVEKVDFEIILYGINTLEISETAGDTGVSVTYVDNDSGASIPLSTDGPMDNNFTAGQESSVTVWARVNSGSGVSVSLHNGVEVVDSELVTSTSGTTVVLRGNMQTTSPYLYTPGMGAGEVIFLSRFGAGPKLEPPTNAVHIWSGTAQSWKKKDSGFDAYDESGYDVKIKKMGGRPVDAVNELLQGKKIDPTRPNQYRRNYR